jgi:hypothetical protein
MEEKIAELRTAAMHLHVALSYAPGEGHKIPESLLELNREMGEALRAVDAASRHEVQV